MMRAFEGVQYSRLITVLSLYCPSLQSHPLIRSNRCLCMTSWSLPRQCEQLKCNLFWRSYLQWLSSMQIFWKTIGRSSPARVALLQLPSRHLTMLRLWAGLTRPLSTNGAICTALGIHPRCGKHPFAASFCAFARCSCNGALSVLGDSCGARGGLTYFD